MSDVITFPLYVISVVLKSGELMPHVEEFENKIYANIEVGQKQADLSMKALEKMMIENKSFSTALNAAGFSTTEVENRKELNLFIEQFNKMGISGIFYTQNDTHLFVNFDNISRLILP